MTNLRQVLQLRMKRDGKECRCIRCREVKGRSLMDVNGGAPPTLMTRTYASSGGTEHFLSYESVDEKVVFGFARLRLSPDAGKCGSATFPALLNTALVRELHVYGQVVKVRRRRGKSDPGAEEKKESQHVGYGGRLMAKAEEIAEAHGFTRVAVIAGIGTRECVVDSPLPSSPRRCLPVLPLRSPVLTLALSLAPRALSPTQVLPQARLRS